MHNYLTRARPVRGRGVAALTVLAVLLAGCTAPQHPAAIPQSPQSQAESPTPSSAPSVPQPSGADPIVQYARDRLAAMTLEQKIASMLMVHVAGTDPAALAAYAAGAGVGGLILMGDNIPQPAEVLAVTIPAMSAEPGLPLVIATDQEGGIVARLPDDALAADQLRSMAPDETRQAFAARGAMLAAAGVTVNFGIVADVTADPASFIYERSFGGTAPEASARVAAAVGGERGTVRSTLKHFPGHGVSPGDSHSEIPGSGISVADWRLGHEPPFAAGITAGAEFVMFGHLQFDRVDLQPATLSKFWHQLLRSELGFDGIAITDDMNMLQYSGRPDLADPYQDAVRAVAAGNTMLLYVGAVDVAGIVAAVASAVRAGSIPVSTINDAALRLLELRRTISGETGRYRHCSASCTAIIE